MTAPTDPLLISAKELAKLLGLKRTGRAGA